MFCIPIICLHANINRNLIMFSNKKQIKVIIGANSVGWTITPESKCDYLDLFSPTEKIKQVKFISDIDSISFNIRVNHTARFEIVLNKKDTAQTEIRFTNQIPDSHSKAEKVKALSQFWSESKYNFAFIDNLHFDIDSLYLAFIPKILDSKNDYEFYDQMELFAASLKDLHSGIYYSKKGVYGDYIPLTVHYFGDSLRIVNGRADVIEQFPLGSVLLKINNLPVREYMRLFVEPRVCSAYPPTVNTIASSRLFASDLLSQTITLTYRTPDGKILKGMLPRNGRSVPGEIIGYKGKIINKLIEVFWERKSIARLVFNSFAPQDRLIKQFESMKDTLYSAKGIIIDLRENRGGSTGTAIHLLKHIIKDSYFLTYAYQTRIANSVKRANGNWLKEDEAFYTDKAYQTILPDTIQISPSLQRFNVPIVVLISEKTCSAAEDFLIMLQERKDRPLFIGRPTMGSTGSPLYFFNFLKDGEARICAKRILFPYSHKPFVEGIKPDILVNYSYEEYMNQNVDKDIDSAINYLLEVMK